MTPAEELRSAFDAAFAAAPASPAGRSSEDFLGMGIAGHPFAVRLREVAGLFVDKPIAPLPSPALALLGIAGFRGVTVPVYDLRSLLGLEASEAPRWMVLVAEKDALALAFDRFEGHLRIASGAIAAEPATGRGGLTREAFRVGEEARTVIDIDAVVRAVTQQAQPRRAAPAER